MLRVALLIALLALALGYAFWRGGAPERTMAALWLCLAVADPLLHLSAPLEYRVVDTGHLIIDLTGFSVATIIALTAYRFWPMLVAVLQFLPLLAHLSRSVDLDMHPAAYLVMQVGSYWLLAPLLVAGDLGASPAAAGAWQRSILAARTGTLQGYGPKFGIEPRSRHAGRIST